MTDEKKWREFYVQPFNPLVDGDTGLCLPVPIENNVIKYLSVHVIEYAAYEKLQSEVERLNKIIAKELSENDDLGAEYTYVNVLKAKLQAAQAELQKCKNEYAEYVRGKPGTWYVTQLQAERDQLLTDARRLAVALDELIKTCQWYAENGLDQERHHFLAVEAEGNYGLTLTPEIQERYLK